MCDSVGLLLFKKTFAVDIRLGRKTTTLRKWDRPRVRAGQRVFAPGVGYLRVSSVEEVRLAELGERDARADGFPDLAALRAALAEMYGPDALDARLFRVAFSFDGDQPTAASSDANSGSTTIPRPRA